MSNYLISHCLHKVQPGRLTGDLFEVEGFISCLCAGGQGFREVGEILWIELISIFMVDCLGCKSCCFWENVLGVIHEQKYEESNEA